MQPHVTQNDPYVPQPHPPGASIACGDTLDAHCDLLQRMELLSAFPGDYGAGYARIL